MNNPISVKDYRAWTTCGVSDSVLNQYDVHAFTDAFLCAARDQVIPSRDLAEFPFYFCGANRIDLERVLTMDGKPWLDRADLAGVYFLYIKRFP